MNRFYLVVAGLFLTTTVFGQDITSDLVVNYLFNENLEDQTENNFDATNVGAVFSEDRFGNSTGAMRFDGIDDYVIMPNDPLLKPELPVSISFWVKYESESFSNNAVFNLSYEDDRSSGIYFNAQMATGNFAVNFGDGSYFFNPTARRTFVSTQTIIPGDWMHVTAIVRGPTDMEIYIGCSSFNGVYNGSGGDLVYSATPGNIGRRDRDLGVPPLYFQGSIDDFRIYNRALSPDDVEVLCTALSVPDNGQKEVAPSLLLYPNPGHEIIQLETKLSDLETLEVYNIMGQKIYEGPYKEQVSVAQWPAGLYLFKALGANGSVTSRFVKR